MLVLTLACYETLQIGEATIHVYPVTAAGQMTGHHYVKIAIDAPRHVIVTRSNAKRKPTAS